jgi:hypothetical protein
MNFFRYFFILIVPVFAFASFEDSYFQSFICNFQEKKFDESLEILDYLERTQPTRRDRILGMKGAVYLAMGELEKSRMFMDECIQNLMTENVSDPLLDYIFQVYYKALEGSPENFPVFNGVALLCKQEQPSGVKLKYWFGIGQILVGILAAPFSGGASMTLVVSGVVTVVDAASDALNNTENWERELNDRQRINPDFQNNSFLNRIPYAMPEMELIRI